MINNDRNFTMSNNLVDQYQFFPYGCAIETFGLANLAAINPFGLVTRGFIWQAYDIWGPYQYATLTTGWTASLGYSSIVTNWSYPSGYSSLVTTWTAAYFNELPNWEGPL